MELKKINELISQDKLVKFYQSTAWRMLRQSVLNRDNYECQKCKRAGKVGKAENVHHIKEVKKHPELALVYSNCESICIPCHNKEHDRLKKYIRKNRVFDDERW
ncbi:HNH endonuclease signature motif containing protein [Bacillus sp. Cs-700]|uniref:HNH endonuclease signature motif containing protein n=1 Tax=Bacillus sp. Cs-700 TaxID=2589818 RepID=UPI00140915CA|nr:HNH endonuclease signature motif containing protein [Bacillus sp. Cs-700]